MLKSEVSAPDRRRQAVDREYAFAYVWFRARDDWV